MSAVVASSYMVMELATSQSSSIMASSSDFTRGRARMAVGPSSSSDISVVVTPVIIAGLTGAVEATSLDAVVEVKAVLGAIGASVTILLMDVLGVEVGLCWLQLF